jgi:hypothetical protein
MHQEIDEVLGRSLADEEGNIANRPWNCSAAVEDHPHQPAMKARRTPRGIASAFSVKQGCYLDR